MKETNSNTECNGKYKCCDQVNIANSVVEKWIFFHLLINFQCVERRDLQKDKQNGEVCACFAQPSAIFHVWQLWSVWSPWNKSNSNDNASNSQNSSNSSFEQMTLFYWFAFREFFTTFLVSFMMCRYMCKKMRCLIKIPKQSSLSSVAAAMSLC